METKQQFNSNSITIPKTAFFIDKIHNCADCPIRKAAMKQPRSFFARMHRWHKAWWPGWKAHQAKACAFAAGLAASD